MKKLLSVLVLFHVLGLSAASAHAEDGLKYMSRSEFEARAHKAEMFSERVKRVHLYEKKVQQLQFNANKWERRAPTVQIPELDANAAGAALALVIGGALVLVERRKQLTA